jgi:hypothetical protein
MDLLTQKLKCISNQDFCKVGDSNIADKNALRCNPECGQTGESLQFLHMLNEVIWMWSE